MTNDDIDRIEAELGCDLPTEYRILLERDADELARAEGTLDWIAVLWTDADEILQGNATMRRYASDLTIGSRDDNQQPWPQHFVVVGTDGGGDYWFVDVTGALTGLWLWQHEAHSISLYSESMDAYMERIRALLKKHAPPNESAN